MGTITIDGIDYTQDANGDWTGSDGSTFTNADFQNYAAQNNVGAGYTTGQGSVTGGVDAGGTPTTSTSTPPAGAVGQSGGNWINAAGQILGPVAVSLATPWWNNLQSGGLLNTATGMLTTSGNALNNIQAPDLTKLIPQLKLQVMQGQMTPAQATAAIQQASQMNNVSTDQASLQGQRDALAKLANIGNNGGMTEADRAALAETMAQTNANAASQRQAQIQALQQQGNAGTGAELAARLSGAQGSANANAMAGAQTAQAAQARALQAIQANLSGNAALNTQQFNQAAQKAQAQDAVNQFNAQAQQATNLANAGFTQQANTNNFNTANTIAGTNTTIQNQQAMLPYEAAQKNYENQLGLGKAQTGAQLSAGTALGKMATDQIARSSGAGTGAASSTGSATAGTGGTGGGTSSGGGGGGSGGLGGVIGGAINGVIGSGIGNAISSGLGYVADWFSDERLKTDKKELSDDDIDNLMAKMTAYKYRYKGPQTNPEQVGIMAQDMPNHSVINTPAGKMIQGNNALGQALAVLANQHERIKKLEGNQYGR